MKIEDDSGEITTLPCEITPVAHSERVKRSLQTFGMFLGAALLSVLVPILHFFLVPLFLFLSVFMGLLKYQQKHFVDLSSVHCPKCNKNLSDKKMYSKNGFIKIYCYACRSRLSLY